MAAYLGASVSVDWGKRILLALLSSLLLRLAFPTFGMALLAWVALVPLLIALRGQNVQRSFVSALITGVSFFMTLCSWMTEVSAFTPTDFILCGLYLGSYFGLFGAGVSFLSQQLRLPSLAIVPLIWVSCEYIRAHAGFLGVPWGLLGHTQQQNLLLIQVASLTGVYGISFLLMVVNTLISEVLLRFLHFNPSLHNRALVYAQALFALLLLLGALAYGSYTLAQISIDDSIRLTVVQGNIPQNLKWRPEFYRLNLDTYVRLTQEASRTGQSALIVWPETTIPGSLTQDLSVSTTLMTLATETRIPLLVGSLQRPRFGDREFRHQHWFNSASLVFPKHGLTDQYSKIHLLPFGEYVPFREVIPWPASMTSRWKEATLLAGNEFTVFNLDDRKFGVLICWESLFPELARRFVNNGATFLVNMTNEAWFGETAAPYQFLAMNVFRAVENRVSIVRAASTGVSCFIDPYGRIIGRVQDQQQKDIFVAGYLTKVIPLAQATKTFYTTYGDVWAYSNMVAALCMFAFTVFSAPRKP